MPRCSSWLLLHWSSTGMTSWRSKWSSTQNKQVHCYSGSHYPFCDIGRYWLSRRAMVLTFPASHASKFVTTCCMTAIWKIWRWLLSRSSHVKLVIHVNRLLLRDCSGVIFALLCIYGALLNGTGDYLILRYFCGDFDGRSKRLFCLGMPKKRFHGTHRQDQRTRSAGSAVDLPHCRGVKN